MFGLNEGSGGIADADGSTWYEVVVVVVEGGGGWVR